VVSKKKFEELAKLKSQLDQDKMRCDTSLAGLNKRYKALSEVFKGVKKDTANLAASLRKLGARFNQLDEDNSSLSKRHQYLEKSYNQLLSNSASEAADLNKDLRKKEKELAELERSLNQTKLDNAALSESLKTREERVKELEKVLEDKDLAVKNLKDKVSKALLSFKEKDLSIQVKNGKVYVSLSEQLLFKSGSYAVDPKGIEALKKLAGVLMGDKEINIMVEGHTDDVPFNSSNSALKDNWDLSVLRASAVTKALTDEWQLSPSRILAAGKGEFSPMKSNETTEGKALNRRIELIISLRMEDILREYRKILPR
jgi:chemotaxis protein MotB